MDSLFNQAAVPRKIMVVFVLVDTSGSMKGSKIGQVNAAMEEILPLLHDISEENADAEIKLAVMSFSTGVTWVTKDLHGNSAPVALDAGYYWTDLTAGGLTEMGAAFKELDKRLSRSEFLESSMGAYAPVILMLSDGYPNDDWKKELGILQGNKWYQSATKLAIAISDDQESADTDVLAQFTRSKETVVQVHDDRMTLKKMLSRLIVVSSIIVSHPTPTSQLGDEETAMQNAKMAVEEASRDVYESDGVILCDGAGSATVETEDFGDKWKDWP